MNPNHPKVTDLAEYRMRIGRPRSPNPANRQRPPRKPDPKDAA